MYQGDALIAAARSKSVKGVTIVGRGFQTPPLALTEAPVPFVGSTARRVTLRSGATLTDRNGNPRVYRT